MQHIIFYSWQGDRPNNTNRGFIKSALDEAATTLATDLTVEPRVDHDTQNVPGSPDIAHTILKKIEASDVFVADVSIINEPDAARPTPNPNVLLELGYAMHALGEDRIILVMNEYYGPVEKLPFDLRARRTIRYSISPEAEEKATERRRLAGVLKAATKAAIENIPQAPPPRSASELARDAVEAVAANRSLLVRNAIREITTKLEALAPPFFRNGGTADELLASIQETAPVVREFTNLAQTVASMNDTEAARALYKSFSTLLEHYDTPRRFQGTFHERDFDYWKFLGHELLVGLIATLMTEDRYSTIKDLLDETITITNHRYRSGSTPVSYEYASKHLHSFDLINKARQRISVRADILRDRHAHDGDYDAAQDGPLAEILPFRQFIAADYLLWLRGELAPADDPTEFFEWAPWSSLYLNDTPDFMHNAVRGTMATALAIALNAVDVATLKERLQRRASRIGRMWPPFATPLALRPEDIERIGTRP